HSYPNAGHLIKHPYLPTTINSFKHPVNKAFYTFGGTPAGTYRASVDVWRKKIAFLNDYL
ncbi:MAG: acyl-CoA thioester hydrolase/BAAT C-terminal domain-containing protein, partial [Chloroflexota bacterium]